MTPEQKLMALMAADTPKQPDPVFEFAVMERLARRGALARFVRLSMIALVMGGLLIALAWGAIHGETAQTLELLAAAGASAVASLVVWTLRQAG